MTTLMLMYASAYVVQLPSGPLLRLNGGGETVEVTSQADVDYLRSIKREMGCCGEAPRKVTVFEIVEAAKQPAVAALAVPLKDETHDATSEHLGDTVWH